MATQDADGRGIDAAPAAAPRLLDVVREAKGAKDRLTVLPENLIAPPRRCAPRLRSAAAAASRFLSGSAAAPRA